MTDRSNKKLTPQILQELFTYNPETGSIIYKPRSAKWFNASSHHMRSYVSKFNARFAGGKAFTSVNGDGYYIGVCLKSSIFAHRVAYAIYYGYMPTFVDHINGDRKDNRICNLRDVPHNTNCQNRSVSQKYSNGIAGINWRSDQRKWNARVKCNKKYYHLGSFSCFGAALKARMKKERELGFSARHGKSRSQYVRLSNG